MTNSEIGRARQELKAKHLMTARGAEHAKPRMKARVAVTARPKPRSPRARSDVNASGPVTAAGEALARIPHLYRLAKTAEDTRNRLQLGITAFVRNYYSGWQPDADFDQRKATAAAAKRVVKHVLRDLRPKSDDGKNAGPLPEVLLGVPPLEPGDDDIREKAGGIIADMAAPWWRFEFERHRHRKEAEAIASTLPAYARMQHVSGFSAWGLVAIVGEAGDLSNYSGVRYLYKRLGLAPDECYPTGERRTGRKIPRAARGRIMGIIADTLLRQQWRGATDDGPGHPIGPFGQVYAEVKQLHLALGKSKGHADKIARRAMVKALLHDVHRAWHGRELHYAGVPDEL